jgi:hypothetical protein
MPASNLGLDPAVPRAASFPWFVLRRAFDSWGRQTEDRPQACDGTSRSRADWHRGARNESSRSWTWLTRRAPALV